MSLKTPEGRLKARERAHHYGTAQYLIVASAGAYALAWLASNISPWVDSLPLPK